MSSENLNSESVTDLSSKIEPVESEQQQLDSKQKKEDEVNSSKEESTSTATEKKAHTSSSSNSSQSISTSSSSSASSSVAAASATATTAVRLVKTEHKFRKGLPGSMGDRNRVSIWSILKQCVDKELYRFTIPIVWNEPLSLLQRMAENMRYANDLLDRAADMSNPVDRMKCVAGFLISCTSIHTARLSKPFNPLLGETYEYTCSRNKFRICCEQVSHHPPVSAYYSESLRPTTNSAAGGNVRKWKYYGSVEPAMKLNLLNACVEAFPNGIQTLEFPELGEVYTWHNLKVTAHNLILGKLWFEYTGRAEIINHKLNMKCILEFKPYSWFSRQLNHCEGYIADASDNKLCLLNGKWDECFFASSDVKNASKFNRVTERLINHENESQLTGVETVWKTVPADNDLRPEFFYFSSFTFELNELYQDLIESTQIEVKETIKSREGGGKEVVELTNAVRLGPIAPTDSRFRPDMQLYEKGMVDEASEQKHRLEEKQRDKQRRTEAGELTAYQPLWFDKGNHPVCKDEETWTFNDNYWKRDFTKCPDIY